MTKEKTIKTKIGNCLNKRKDERFNPNDIRRNDQVKMIGNRNWEVPVENTEIAVDGIQSTI